MTEFVGFVAVFKDSVILLGISGSLIALWATFVACWMGVIAMMQEFHEEFLECVAYAVEDE